MSEVVDKVHKTALRNLCQVVRVAVTGDIVSPPIYTVLELLGKDRTLARLRKAIEYIDSQSKESQNVPQ